MNAFGSSRSPFGQSLFGGSNNQSQQPQQQMQNPFMQSSGGGFGGGFGQPQMPAYAQGYMNNMGGFGGNQGFGGGFNPMQGGYGGQMQNPFMAINQGGFGGGYGGGYGGGMGFGGQPQRPMGGGQMMVGYGGTAENGYQTPGGFGGFGMERPQVVGGFGGIEQDQEFLGYQKQGEDLSRQMNEYMQKAPMYQQLQDLQGKMRGVQSKYAPPQRSFNQAPQGQLGGLAGLLGGLGGMGGRGGMPQQGAYEQYVDRNNRALASPTQEVKQPTMSRADFDARERQMMSPARQQFNPAYFG